MSQDPDVRWRQRGRSFRKAFGQLARAAAGANERELSSLERLGLIHVFKYTHELAWNTLRDFLLSRGGRELYGSRDATRQAFAQGLIEEGEVWMEMITSRNQTSHTYQEETANGIAEAIRSRYVAVLARFLERFTELEKGE